MFDHVPPVNPPAGPGNVAARPAIRPDYSAAQRAAWLQRHASFVELARRGGIDALFLGDSLTDYWRSTGEVAWSRCFAPLRAANFGISGDRTQQLLWRLTQGELEGLKPPKVVVLLIGTNNLDAGLGENSLTPRNSVPEIVEGIAEVAGTIQRQVPTCHLLLHGLLPRGLPEAPVRREISMINQQLQSLHAGDSSVTFADLGPRLLSPDGTTGSAFDSDMLHLSAAGYESWAGLLEPMVRRLLGCAE